MSLKLRQLAMITAGLVLAVGLASCDDRGTADSADPSSSKSSSSADPSDDAAQSSESSKAEDGDKPDSNSDVKTLSGTVEAGVEPGCLMLESGGEKYQLIGDKARKLKVGAKVEVTGKISEKAMTTCMEGRVFEVDSVTTL